MSSQKQPQKGIFALIKNQAAQTGYKPQNTKCISEKELQKRLGISDEELKDYEDVEIE